MLNKIVIPVSLVFLVLCSGCNQSSGTGSLPANYKVVSSSITASDKGLVYKNSSASLKSQLIQARADGSLSLITFEVVDPITNEIMSHSVNILKTLQLSSTLLAFKLSDYRTVIVDITSGDVYDLKEVLFEEMQVHNNNLYYLKEGILIRINLNDPTLAIHEINNPVETAWNSTNEAFIHSELNDVSGSFNFFAFNQYGVLNRSSSPSFVFASNNYILAKAGPSGGRRNMMFKEGQQAYDCNRSEMFSNVGGGHTGGVIQTADGNLYQIRIVTPTTAADRGARLVRYNFSETASCWTQTVVSDLGVIANLESSIRSNNFRVNYKLNDLTRYVIYSKGFLKVSDNGSGGLNFTWTDLDLSGVPALANYINRWAVIEGDYLYWQSGNSVHRILLSAGEVSTLFYAGTAITKFDIIDGELIVVDSGSVKIIRTPGGLPEVSSLLNDFDAAISF